MAKIVLEGVSKIFPDGTAAVRDLDLDIGDGEFVVFVGPSGSGKSTALRMIAGLEDISNGTIKIGDRVVNELPPRDRDIAMVFQNYALYPHMSVADNMGFALKLRKIPKDEIARRVKDAAELLGIEALVGRKPRALSGGQRQRVAMGRAIVREPAAFLMDEPLSNLDAKLRVQMRSEIARLHQRLGTTTVYVTHDQIEAVTMADRVAVLRDGQLQQFDTPANLYQFPLNLFVAGFIGSPAMNLIEARISSKNGAATAAFGGESLPLPSTVARGVRDGAPVILGLRPEAFEDPEFAPKEKAGHKLEVNVSLVETLGAETMIYFEIDAPPVASSEVLEAADLAHEQDEVDRMATGKAVFTARLHPKTKAKAGERMTLAIDLESAYVFDPATGKSLR